LTYYKFFFIGLLFAPIEKGILVFYYFVYLLLYIFIVRISVSILNNEYYPL